MAYEATTRSVVSSTVCHALDAGHTSFSEVVKEQFHDLSESLIKQCDRIAMIRELHLRKRLERSESENILLTHKLYLLTAKAREVGLSSALDELHKIENKGDAISSAAMPRSQSQLAQETSVEAELEAAAMVLNDKAKPLAQDPSQSQAARSVSLESELADEETDPPGCEGLANGETVKMKSTPSVIILGEEDGTELCTERSTKQSIIQQNYHLWPDWIDDESAALKSVSILSMDDQEETQMEIDWLRRREPASQGHIVCSENKPSCFIISPSSPFAIFWEVASVPALFYDLVTIPLQVFHEAEGVVSDLMTWSVIMYWTLDMILRFGFFGFVNRSGILELNRSRIVKRYIASGFLFDFIMIAPDWFAMAVGGPRNVSMLRVIRVVRLVRLMRMTKMKRIMRVIHDTVDSEYFSVVINITINLLSIVGTCHYIACFWFFVGSQKFHGYESWVDRSLPQDAAWQYKYVVSMFWAISQFTPGSSKVQPQNIPECVVAICVLIFGIVFFSLFVAALTQHRMHLQALTSKMDRDHWILRRYLKQHGVSTDLAIRTIRYVDACVAPQLQRVQRKDVALLEHLSKPLQLEVQAEMYYHTLLVHPFLHRLKAHSISLSSQLFAKVVIEIWLAHTDLLFEVGQVSHEMFFVARGTVAYLLGGTKEVEMLGNSDWCCEPVIWVPWVHKGTARAAEECDLISMDAAKMRQSVLEHKDRSFVRRCAQAYLMDLNRYAAQGKVISDTIHITKDEHSEYRMELENDTHRREMMKSSMSLTGE